MTSQIHNDNYRPSHYNFNLLLFLSFSSHSLPFKAIFDNASTHIFLSLFLYLFLYDLTSLLFRKFKGKEEETQRGERCREEGKMG